MTHRPITASFEALLKTDERNSANDTCSHCDSFCGCLYGKFPYVQFPLRCLVIKLKWRHCANRESKQKMGRSGLSGHSIISFYCA